MDTFAIEVSSLIPAWVTYYGNEQMPDLADLFPFRLCHTTEAGLSEGVFIVTILNIPAGGRAPLVGPMDPGSVQEIGSKLAALPDPWSHSDLKTALGADWFTPDRFTYAGRLTEGGINKEELENHLVSWLNKTVLPDIANRNTARVLRVLPKPPRFALGPINEALWVLETKTDGENGPEIGQGTAFALEGVGLVTCQHVLKRSTIAFRASAPGKKFSVAIVASEAAIDLAVLSLPEPNIPVLPRGTAENLRFFDTVLVTGFPNYRLGDTPSLCPGQVSGFRPVSGVRRFLITAPIICGNSGGPIIGADNRVVGVAVTGADRMENAAATENHGGIPIDALSALGL